MDSTKITRLGDGWHKNSSPKRWTDGELNDPVSTKITLQRMENQMVGTKITRKRMENQIVSTKITRQRAGQYKNNSPKGWVAQK